MLQRRQTRKVVSFIVSGRARFITLALIAFIACSMPYVVAQAAQDGSQAPRPAHAKQVPAKDDIEAVGTRNIGKTGAGNWYTLEKEQSLGQKYAQALEQNTKLLKDRQVTEYVNRVAQNIVRNSDARVAFRVRVIESDEINAIALPGGYLYVNSGLILASQDEAELAGVMAHEIAHVAARHATRQMTRSTMFNLASIPLIFVGGGLGAALQYSMGFAKPLSLTKFSRTFETEADYLGVQYLYKAGYDPQALVSFFERVRAMERQQHGIVAQAFSSHPQTSDRVKRLQRELATVLPPRDSYVVSTSEFDEAVARLLRAGNTVRPLSEAPRPTLRRRTPDSTPNAPDQHSPASSQ